MAQKHEQFSNRWGIILASLGMAIGAGNLWRFPRLAGQYGGTFLILWVLFLLVWSIPLLLAEFGLGKKYKKSVIGSYASATGEKFTWAGFFIAMCTLGITFYYSVVTAWGLRYLGFALSNLGTEIPLSQQIESNPDYLQNLWKSVSTGNFGTLGLHFVALALGVFILIKGVQKGLERANKILIPSLFILLFVIISIALNMDGGIKGLDYMFTVRPELFTQPKVWIEAISQSAWSTGAGWGLMMTLSAYSRDKEDVTLNTFIGGFGNNTASLLAGMAILPAVFALAPSETEAVNLLNSGNQALIFTVIPALFAQVFGGEILAIIFFMAFSMAALSSLLAMMEMLIKLLMDWGFERDGATLRTGIFCLFFGLPSAWSLDFFSNQDWVWGVGLIISGIFIVFAVAKIGFKEFRNKYIDQDSDFRISTLYFSVVMVMNGFLGIGLLYWWLSQDYSASWFDKNGNWDLFGTYSNASTLTQWLFVLLLGIVLNRFLYRKFN